MARNSEPDDYSKLLAEVERSLNPAAAPATRASGAKPPATPSAGSRGQTALVAGGVAAAVVFLLFALLPFLGAVSGAAGAFLGASAAAYLLRRR